MADLLRLQVVLDTSALDALKLALTDSPRQFYQVVNDVILPRAQRRLDALLNKPGAPTGGHYQFSTLKSQRYYFATHKPPYQRTGTVLQWRIVLKAFSGRTIELTFENPVPYSQYVFGSPTQQQVIGMRGRWLDADNALVGEVEAVLNDLAEVWVEQFEAEGKAA